MSSVRLVIFTLSLIFLAILSFGFIYIDFFKSLFVSLFKRVRINNKLKKFCIDHDYLLLSDVYIRVKTKKYMKIDNIIIANKYIYVITNKCWYGYLNAKAIDEKWLLYRQDKLKHLKNPLINNRQRINVLAKFLDSSLEDFVNVIYLARPVVSDKISTNNDKEFVIFEDEFEKFIEVYEKECKLSEFSLKSIENAGKKIFDYHKKSLLSFKQQNYHN